MKKLLSTILSIIMVASMFSIIAVPTVMAEESATTEAIIVEDFADEASMLTPTYGKASYDDGAMKIDFTDNVYAPAKAWNGVLVNVPVDTSLLDANTLYNISVKLRTENASNIVCYAKAYTTINGIEHQTRVNANTSPNHQFLGTDTWAAATEGLPTEWTEFTGSYKEVTTTIAGAGSSLRLEVYLYSSLTTGSAWIDDIKLIPVESSKIAGGSVKFKGTDNDGNTVYTAKADDGFAVGTIAAKTCKTTTAVLTQTVTEISRTNSEVVFTVSSDGEEYNLNGRYITVSFDECQYIDENGAVVVKTFSTEASMLTPTYGKASYDDGAMKIDFTDNVYAPAKAWNGVLVNVPVDTSLLDANTLYNISVKLRTENASSIVCYAKAYTTINGIEYLTRVNGNGSPNHQFLGTDTWAAATSGIPTEWTEFTGSYKDVTTTIAGAGNSMRLEVYLYSSVAEGSAWIDDIKLIPEKTVGGSVKVTGTDENGNTVYTAKADDGYTVGTITAKTCRSNTAVLTQTVTEISRTKEEVVFTVSSATEEYNLNGRYITVNFDANETYVDSNGNIILKEFTALTSDVSGTGREIDTEKAYSGGTSLKVSLAAGGSACSGFYNKPGATVTIYPDMELLDVNQKYRLRVTYATDNQDVTFRSFARFFGTVNGTSKNAVWDARNVNDYPIFNVEAFATDDWKQFITSQTFSPFGNDFYIQLNIYTETVTTGSIWIDKLELIPVNDGIDDGVVRVTGTTDDGNTLYTAYANEGYTVDAIYAKDSVNQKALNVNIVEKVSDREVSFTVENSDYIANFDISRYYINAIFGSEKPIIMDADDEYIVSDLSENTYENLGNATSLSEDGLYTGSCYATDADSATFDVFIDANTINKFDAANDYKLSALVQSTEDWVGNIYVKIYSTMGTRDVGVLSDLTKGEFYLVGDYTAYDTPDSIFGWAKYYSNEQFVFPVAGERMLFRITITRTSDTGTVYLDNIAIGANTYSNNYVQPVDYSVQNGFVKSRYDFATDSIIYTPIAFDGYEFEDMTVKFRNWDGVTIEGVDTSETIFEMPKTLLEVKSVTERSYAVSAAALGNTSGTARLHTFWNKGKYCTVSFKEAVADVIGDANSDTKVNVLDFIRVKKHLADSATDLRIINVDYNETLTLDNEDLIALVKQLLGVTA